MTEQPDSRYWMYHFWFLLIYPASLLTFLVTAPLGDRAMAVAFGVIGLVTAGAALGSFVGYYAEAKRFEAAGRGWKPRWAPYMVLQLVFTPFIVAPVYLFDRWRAVGIPWEELRVR